MSEELNIKELSLYEKLWLITDEIATVSKNLSVGVGKGSYKAVSEKDILDAVKPIENKYRVYSYPFYREIVDSAVLTKETEYEGRVSKTNSLFMRIQTTYRFINIDNPEEYIDVITYGDGIDTGDKATGKAMTYSDKYALMKAYKISTGDDPDAVKSEEYTSVSEDKATAKQVAYIRNNLSEEELQQVLTKWHIKDLSEISKAGASLVIQNIKS